MRKLLVMVAGVFLLCASTAHAQDKVLVFSKTAAFRHDSIPHGIAAVEAIGAANGLTVEETEDASAFTAANLAQYKAVIWLSTTGDVLNAAQQNAFESYIHFGGGYVGVHAAADTEYDWPWYGEIVGAWLRSQTEIQQATVDVTDRAHPSTRDLPASWTRTDEWYDFGRDPSGSAHVLATVREHPIAWCRQFEGGRSWYTGMGHTQESFADANFRKHLTGGILWAAGLSPGECHVEPQPCAAGSDEFDESALHCRWSIVRPNASAYALGGGALTITTESGAKNLFVQRAPSGGYEVTTKVTLNASSGGQQAALLIYQDDENSFRLGQVTKDGGRWLEVVQEVGGTTRHDATLDRRQLTGDYPATFFLRLTQSEGTVIASASPDGMNWSPVGRAGTVATFTAPKIGLAAATGDDDFVTTAAFDWFHLSTLTGGEDTTAPVVTASPDGLRTFDGGFLSSATVTLVALDLGSGVDTVQYALGDGAFVPYTTPVKVPATGTVRYRASDTAGNTSAIGSVAVTIAAAPKRRTFTLAVGAP